MRFKTWWDVQMKQESIPVGCIPPTFWLYPIVSGGGTHPPSGVGTHPLTWGGTHLPRGGYSPPCEQTHTCENITFLQIRLRAIDCFCLTQFVRLCHKKCGYLISCIDEYFWQKLYASQNHTTVCEITLRNWFQFLLEMICPELLRHFTVGWTFLWWYVRE